MTSPELDVRTANEGFYAAFAECDLGAMERLWARAGTVCCIHPGWAALEQRAPIMASWASILGNDSTGIRCDSVRVRLSGDMATVVCEEVMGEIRLAATNGFVLEHGIWRIWHHHAGPISRRVRTPENPLLN